MRSRSALLVVLLSYLLIHGCGPKNGVADRSRTREPQTPKISRLIKPEAPLNIPLGSVVDIELQVPDSVTIDSMQIFLAGTLKETLIQPGDQPLGSLVKTSLSTQEEHTGRSGLRVRVYMEGGITENQSQQITFLSDQKPVEYAYRVIREYPHDPEAFTQGLEYVDGWLYEGTGNRGTSSLRRVNLNTGEVVQIRNLDQSLFGEGITVFGERIYQVTYTSQVGFIYDKSSFEEIQKIYYQNREGWGLTNNGEELIMSDGTHILYFLDPEMFTVNRQIEVYHDQGPAQSLNELEFIDGKIWANRYYTDEVVIIDPETGKVEGRINLKGILKTRDRNSKTDVLNGIAWDEENERIFVTGKYWPKLFEIVPVPL